jgi:hypothetical protein
MTESRQPPTQLVAGEVATEHNQSPQALVRARVDIQ